jgi:hypothetical protein
MRTEMRRALLCTILAACGGPAPPPPEPARVEATAVEVSAEPEASRQHAEVPEPEAAPQPPEEPAPAALAPIDHRSTRCFTDAPATSHALGDPFTQGSLRIASRGSARANAQGHIGARPGEIVRFELTIENVGSAPVELREREMDLLRELTVVGLRANWRRPLTSPSELPREGRLEPGAVLRLCHVFEIAAEPIDAAAPRDEPQRVYTIVWPHGFRQGGVPLSLGQQTLLVRYPRPRGRAVREPDSWGGVIAIELAPGASIETIARESRVRIGSGVQVFTANDHVPDTRIYVEAPPDRSVRDAAAALEARDDVVRATPLMRGDPGTEGCSEYSPCGAGQACCYMCGIEGCPNRCYPGRSCPGGIP